MSDDKEQHFCELNRAMDGACFVCGSNETDSVQNDAINYHARVIELTDEHDKLKEDLFNVKKIASESMRETADLVFENRSLKNELEELQICLKKAIMELDLAKTELIKWERDFMVVVNAFKSLANRIDKQ